MTWAEALLVVTVAFVAGAAADAVIESFRRARAVIDAPLPDHDDTLDVMDAVFPPTRAEGKDVP